MTDPKPFDGPAPGINLRKEPHMHISTDLKVWAIDTAVRAVKTFGQATVASLGIAQSGLIHASWGADFATGGAAALVCVLNNLTTLPLVKNQDGKVVEVPPTSPAA